MIGKSSNAVKVTKPVTPGLLIQVPDVEVSSAKIDGDRIDVQFRPAPRIGPFGEEALLERLIAGGKETGRVRLLEQHNYSHRLLPANALEEFMGIRRPQEAATFIQKYGPLAGFSGLVMPFSFVLQQQQQLSVLLSLNKAVAERKKEDIKACLKNAIAADLDITDPSNPSKTIAFHLTKHLATTVPALLPVEGGIQSVLICPHVMTGLYGLLLGAVVENKPWELCDNCGRLFRTSHAKKRFCDDRCQRIAKQQRYRDRQVKSPKKKGSLSGRKRSTKG